MKTCQKVQKHSRMAWGPAGAMQDDVSDLEEPSDANVLRDHREQNSNVPPIEAQDLCAGMLTACIAPWCLKSAPTRLTICTPHLCTPYASMAERKFKTHSIWSP